MSAAYDIVAVEAIGGYRLRLTFADGLSGDIDLAERIDRSTGRALAPLRDLAYFLKVRVDSELRTIVWPNGADLAPDVLYAQVIAAA